MASAAQIKVLILSFVILLIFGRETYAQQNHKLPLKCDSGEYLVQKRNKQLESNGCSKPDFIQVRGEEDFAYCCDRHDVCYGMCGASKEYCDKDFRMCMLNLCKYQFSENRDCQSAASTYALGTQMFGHAGFEDSQNEFCTCIPNSNVIDHYTSLIDDFYANYVDEELRKDGSTILATSAKAVNSGTADMPEYKNLYKIYYELHKKYHNAIKLVHGREDQDPPNFKKTEEL